MRIAMRDTPAHKEESAPVAHDGALKHGDTISGRHSGREILPDSCARAACALFRLPVSFMVAVSSAFGYLLVQPVPDIRLALTFAGTFLLASACSVLNQVQERDTDALFSRTAVRPLPAGRLTLMQAQLCASACFALALACFVALNDWALLWLYVVIIVLYNGVYTPLKRRTAFSLLVGAVPGALPPVTGWIAAGGSVWDTALGALFVVYYLWQVPHFWLRAERDADEYARAGLPVPILHFGATRYARLLRVWFHAYIVGLLMLPLFSFMHTTAMRVSVTLCAMAVLLAVGLLLHAGQNRRALHWINASLLAVMVLLLADRMWLAHGML
ncbi:protoheme IX farnesyltransferase [Desulfovibrio psychrotolerans]|nr:protoheme IX farnesyltransferase [Desulfovibrio psychrotolerans]